jgi:hypothetical protein
VPATSQSSEASGEPAGASAKPESVIPSASEAVPPAEIDPVVTVETRGMDDEVAGG